MNLPRGALQNTVAYYNRNAANGLVGLLMTLDYGRGDREIKLLYHCTPEEIYLTNGFINFDRQRMEGTLVLRHPMLTLWG